MGSIAFTCRHKLVCVAVAVVVEVASPSVDDAVVPRVILGVSDLDDGDGLRGVFTLGLRATRS